MRFELVIDLDGVSYYGHIPELSNCPDSQSELFRLERGDWALLDADFVDPVNKLCGTLLDNGDVDYFDAEQCKALRAWLEERLSRDCDGRLKVVYGKLLDFATRAIELDTGVIVEL